MDALDIPFLAEIFFGIGLFVFCIAVYVILPAFLYNKRTAFRPKLINAMWSKLFAEPKLKLSNKTPGQKKSQGASCAGIK